MVIIVFKSMDQVKRYSALYLLNKHNNLQLLFLNFCLQIIHYTCMLKKFKKKIHLRGKKGIAKSVHKALYSRMKIKILKAMRWGTFWINVIWNCVIFPLKFLPKVSSFFQVFPKKPLLPANIKMYCETMKWCAW